MSTPHSPAAILLSSEQRDAVERIGQDVCVVAGPGSGKTRVLIERFAWLVEAQEVPPESILAITFTEKAAIEIKLRLVARFAGRPDLREAIERAAVSTIHGFCARVLQENAIAAGLAPDFTVLEQHRAEALARQAAESALDELFVANPTQMRRLLEALDLSTSDGLRQMDLAATLLSVYESIRLGGADDRDSLQILAPLGNAAAPANAFDLIDPICDQILRDSTTPNTANQREELPKLRDWAARMRSLDRAKVTDEHFAALAAFADVKRGSLVRKSASAAAAKQFKEELKPQVEAQWILQYYAGLDELLAAAIRSLDTIYRGLKRRESALDFSDLEEYTATLLATNPEVRDKVQRKFDHILMDELQDTNPVQWRLLDLVRTPGGFFAVGDINQSIYGFRHANPEGFAAYREDTLHQGGVIDELQGNYRSREQVLAVVAATLDDQPGIEARELIARREFTQPPIDGLLHVERLVGHDPGEDPEEQSAPAASAASATTGGSGELPHFEADLIAQRIQQFVGTGEFGYKDIAILIRTLSSAEPIEAALLERNIPYLLSGGRGFLDTRESLDLLNFLAALVNPLDEFPLAGVLRGPLVGLADQELFEMDRKGWRKQFEGRFGYVRRLAGFLPPDRLVAQALDATGYLSTLTERQRANVDKLLALLRREFRNRPRPLANLLDDLEALRDARNVAEAPPVNAGDVVRIMTVHSAKGLEFPVVFLASIHRGTDTSRAALLYSQEAGLGARWRHPVTGKGSPDAAHRLLDAQIKEREAAEENRLLYVAMTRAEQHLVVSYMERSRPSRWQKLLETSIPEASFATAGSAQEVGAATPAESNASAKRRASGVLLAPPEVTAQFDSTASVTSIAQFRACPRQYYLSRYLGLDVAAADAEPAELTSEIGPEWLGAPRGSGSGLSQSPALRLGIAVHRLLAGDGIDADEVLDGTPLASIEAEARALAERFTNHPLGQRAARATLFEHESPVLLELHEIILRGQIDLWFEQGGELVLVDYKTDRDQRSASTYALQLRIYALALERRLGRLPDRAILFYLRAGQPIDVSLTHTDLAHARASVAQFREAQESLLFPLSTGDHCHRCSFYGGLCPASLEEPGAVQESGGAVPARTFAAGSTTTHPLFDSLRESDGDAAGEHRIDES